MHTDLASIDESQRADRGTRVLACAYACAPPGSETFHGGEELLGWRLTQQLARFHAVDVLVSAEHETSVEEAEHPPGMRFHFIDMPSWLHPLRERQGGVQLYAYLWQVRAWRVARKLHRRRAYDLFHHLTYANDWMASWAGALLEDVPFVRGPGGGAHRVPLQLLPSYPWRFRLAQRLRSGLQKLLRRDPVFRKGQRRASTLLVCTEEALRVLPPDHRTKAELMPVVGVTKEAFDVERRRERSGDMRVLSAGKLLPHKGFNLAIHAFGRAFPNDGRAHLSVVGQGPEGESLHRLADSLSIEGRVHFEGWKARENLLQQMADADVFLFPSLRDGGGAVVVEAMAAGTPVICVDTAGPGLHVTESTGIKVDPAPAEEVVQSLAEALEELADDPDRRRDLGRAARNRAWEHYRWEHHGDRLAEIHEAVLASGGRPLELVTDRPR